MAKKGTTKYKSNKQEKEVAKLFGGKQVIASGSLWFADSDVRSDKYLIECKTTEKDYYTLTAKVWEKIQEEAIQDHMRTPLMVIDLKDTDRYVVFRPKDFSKSVVSPLLSSVQVNKSVRITSTMVGEMETGDYIHSQQFILSGKQNNVLCVMMYKDFEEEFKEEL